MYMIIIHIIDDNDDVEGWFREHKYEAMFSAFGAFLLILFGIGACVVGVRVSRVDEFWKKLFTFIFIIFLF